MSLNQMTTILKMHIEEGHKEDQEEILEAIPTIDQIKTIIMILKHILHEEVQIVLIEAEEGTQEEEMDKTIVRVTQLEEVAREVVELMKLIEEITKTEGHEEEEAE